MNKWAEILAGLVLLAGMILVAWFSSAYSWTIFGKDIDFLHAGWIFLKGGIFWLVIGTGILLILLGIGDLKD
jgi:hypothetical protein